MSKYGKEDVYVTASDGTRVLREMLSQYELKKVEIFKLKERNDFHSSDSPEKIEKLEEESEEEDE